MTDKARSLALLSFAVVAVLALWFSASSVLPSLVEQHALTAFQQSLYTSAVQLGFVAGSLGSALLGLADRLDPRRLFGASAVIAAAANASLLVLEPGGTGAAAARFLTGACMAGVYPVGMKIASTWAKGDMGLVVGLLVGALTLGSASPHLFNALGGLDWRLTVALCSAAAILGAFAIHFVELGPRVTAAPPFRPSMVLWAWRLMPLRLANLGYLGHMWELYAMWAWIGIFLQASFALNGQAVGGDATGAAYAAKLVTFATIGVGALGCLLAGYAADRVGRTTTTIVAMAVSGSCALLVGASFGAAPWLVTAICLVWGVSIVADSAQFSASVAELSNKFLVGTMLTVQTALGFSLTLITIHLMPLWVEAMGWRYAMMPLAVGPALGIWAMARLRAHPEASRLASGNR